MGEIAMPILSALPTELTAAMNIFGGSDDMTTLSAENGSQVGSFGDVLGLLMANSALTQVQIQPVPEVKETEAMPEMTAADILSEALDGSSETTLPQVFTENGAKAFVETFSRIFPKYDGEKLPEDTLSLWQDISPEEKKAFAELLNAAADFSEDESVISEKSPEDIVRIICRIMVSSVRKLEKKESDKPEISDEAVLLQGMNLLRPVQTVSPNSMDKEDTADGEDMIAVENVPIERTEAVTYPEMTEAPETYRLREADDILPVQGGNSAETITQSVENVPFADIRDTSEKLSEADPEDIAGFCRKLADELNASVKETVPEAAPEITDNEHFEFGRQSMQGFLARVNRYEGLISDESGEPITEQLSDKPDLTNVPLDRTITEKNYILSQEEALYREEIPSQEDIPSQIMRQIDIYRDIFEEHFSEKEISMKLNPESLGGVEIKIKRSGKGFEITFTAEKAEVAELIGSKASELSEVLASKGIALKEMSVTRQIVTNGSSGDFTDGGAFDKGGLFDGTGNGQTGSERRFSFSGQTSSEALEQADESSSDTFFNREAKLWVSA